LKTLIQAARVAPELILNYILTGFRFSSGSCCFFFRYYSANIKFKFNLNSNKKQISSSAAATPQRHFRSISAELPLTAI
jgi:hypothetical protein